MWKFRLLDVLKVFAHESHLNFIGPSWLWFLRCKVSCFFLSNTLLHLEHVRFFLTPWTILAWKFLLRLVENVFSQISHWKLNSLEFNDDSISKCKTILITNQNHVIESTPLFFLLIFLPLFFLKWIKIA